MFCQTKQPANTKLFAYYPSFTICLSEAYPTVTTGWPFRV